MPARRFWKHFATNTKKKGAVDPKTLFPFSVQPLNAFTHWIRND